MPGFDPFPLWLSLRVAFCATLLSLLIGVPFGWLLARRRLPARAVWEGASLLPLVLPPTVLGYYLLVAFGQRSLPGRGYHALTGSDLTFTWQGAVLAACIVSVPLLIRTVQLAFSAVDPELLEMARTLGATEWQAFRLVLLPLSRNGVVAGVGLAFARALGDYGATRMIGGDIPGATQTMPLAVYDAVYSGDERTAFVYVVLLSLLAVAFCVVASALAHRETN